VGQFEDDLLDVFFAWLLIRFVVSKEIDQLFPLWKLAVLDLVEDLSFIFSYI